MNQGEPLRYRTKSAVGALERIELLRLHGIELELSLSAPAVGARNYRLWRWPQLRQDISIWIHLADLDEPRLRGSAG